MNGAEKALRWQGTLRGRSFCEWGSEIGLISNLAALSGVDAFGMETKAAFVTEAEALCRDFKLTAVFVCGSFVPAKAEECFGVVGTYGATDWYFTRGVHERPGRHCADMDLNYACH